MQYLKIIMFCLILVCLSASEGLAFRCGPGLVTAGDKKIHVQTACGIPTLKEKACNNAYYETKKEKKGKIIKSQKCSQKVEIWYYNCGDNDFIYALTFEDNKLIREATEGRGSGKSDCLGR